MSDFSPEDWQPLDELLFQERLIQAIKAYRTRTGTTIHEAAEAIDQREQELRRRHPERFKTDADYRREAYERLQAITARILVIEGSWDGDSWGWFIRLSAITDEPSDQHPHYSERGLYLLRTWDRIVERATEFGTELARSVGVGFYLTDDNELEPDDGKRWWNQPTPQH